MYIHHGGLNKFIGGYVKQNWEKLFHEKYEMLDGESPFDRVELSTLTRSSMMPRTD